MTRFQDLAPAIQALYPADIPRLYEIHEWRNATVVFTGVHPVEME